MNDATDRTGSRRGSRPLLRLVPLLLAGGLACADAGPTETPSNGPDPDPFDTTLSAGASARDLLASDDYDRLLVEVQYVSGFRPTDGALQELEDFLNARLDKPGGIVIQLGAPLSIAAQASYSTADVRALEQQHRTAYTEGSTLATYLLFLDGEFAGGSNVLGIAYNNTSMAVFGERIGDFTGGLGEPSQETVEATVANHEFGHILGLVNNGSAMQTEHQDEPNGSHCDDPNCLMHYSVRLQRLHRQPGRWDHPGSGPELPRRPRRERRAVERRRSAPVSDVAAPDPLGRRRVTREHLRGPNRPSNELTPAVWADARQRPRRARPAEGALEATDHRFGRVRREVPVAPLAVRSEPEHRRLSRSDQPASGARTERP